MEFSGILGVSAYFYGYRGNQGEEIRLFYYYFI